MQKLAEQEQTQQLQHQQQQNKKKKKNFRKRSASVDDQHESGDEEERRMALEEVKFLQKLRERKSGIPAVTDGAASTGAGIGAAISANTLNKNKNNDKVTEGLIHPNSKNAEAGDADKDDLVLQDTFAQETAVMVEDPNMSKYVELELAKKRGKKIDTTDQIWNDLKRAEDKLYKIPEHLKVKGETQKKAPLSGLLGSLRFSFPLNTI